MYSPGPSNTLDDIIKSTTELFLLIVERRHNLARFNYDGIFKYNANYKTELGTLNSSIIELVKRFERFINPSLNNLDYDKSKYSENEKQINEIKINFIKSFCNILINTSGHIISIIEKIINFMVDTSHNTLLFDVSDTNNLEFVQKFTEYIKTSFYTIIVTGYLVDTFKDFFNGKKSITDDDITPTIKHVLDILLNRIYNKDDKEKSYDSIYDYLNKKLSEFDSAPPNIGMTSQTSINEYFAFLREIIDEIYDKNLAFNITEIVKCMDILFPKDSTKLYFLIIDALNDRIDGKKLEIDKDFITVFGLDKQKDRKSISDSTFTSENNYNGIIEKLENEIREINNDMLRFKHTNNRQEYYTRLRNITNVNDFKTQTDREPQDFIAQIKLKNIGGKQNIGKYKYITEYSLGKAVNNNRARELANNYNQLTDKMIETEKKIGGIQKLAIHDLNKSDNGYIRMRGGEQQTNDYNKLIKQYQLMAIKQNNIINEIKNIKNKNC